MKKSGQFYLLSAIVIISILIGFSTISTYTKKGSDTRVFDLGEELDIESANVLDFGTFPGNLGEGENLDDFLIGFIGNYSGYIGDDKELSFIIGNPDAGTATVVNYEEIETACSNDNGISSCTTIIESDIIPDQPVENDEVNIVFNNETYNFKLKKGQNFFFVISQDTGVERHTTRSGRGQ